LLISGNPHEFYTSASTLSDDEDELSVPPPGPFFFKDS
jgi:hypothetical protein